MSRFRTLDDLNAAGRRVLVRVDLNVPFRDGRVSDHTRIDRVLPTIRELSDKGAKVILLAHFGRPKGERQPELSLEPVAAAVSERLGRPVGFAPDCVGEPAEKGIAAMADGDVLLLENTRFHAGEERNDDALADRMAALGDAFVADAFSCAHRAHVSTEGLARRLETVAGRCMEAELTALESALGDPERPAAALVGGAKVSTKLDVLENLSGSVDLLIIGGAMANTFLLARGFEVGRSLAEPDLVATAQRIMFAAENRGCEILLPLDAVVADSLAADVDSDVVDIAAVPADRMILDVGPKSIAQTVARLEDCRTLMWNGPMGAFETPPFDRATVEIARAAARLTKSGKLNSVAGGGDTVAALNHADAAADFSYVSTAGGAFLEWIEGKVLPGVAVLQR
ncbi:MAG: phosphoglycerate kinase [Rhizobiales bacterium NRL2]|jgi:phosphoglycerate kinase|nr:MAG: phosphoglycerate kinase [Rhizobiales bacterium NRL2]